jgi:heme oxygenase
MEYLKIYEVTYIHGGWVTNGYPNTTVVAFSKEDAIEKALSENTALLDEMAKQFEEVISDKSYYTKGNQKLYTGYKPQLDKMRNNKEEILNQLLAQEERNARLAAHGLDPAATGQAALVPLNAASVAVPLL